MEKTVLSGNGTPFGMLANIIVQKKLFSMVAGRWCRKKKKKVIFFVLVAKDCWLEDGAGDGLKV